MTPKEKARELFDKYYDLFPGKYKIDFGYRESKKCALVAVDEILNSGKDVDEFADAYWQEVKNEIKKL
jgi:hypothetical protein